MEKQRPMLDKGSIDPITVSVIWKNLASSAEEMGAVLRRTAFSPALREAKDFSASIHDARGQLVAHGHFTPGHTGAAMRGVPRLLSEFDTTKLVPGDGLLTNDLALTLGHLPDMFSVVPVFVEDEIAAYAVTSAHHVDVGGPAPGSLSIEGVRDVYAEGLRVTPIKYYVAGHPNPDVFQLIRDNVRLPDRVEGDLKAQMNANRRGVERFQELVARHSLDTVRAAMREMLDRSESAMRRAIRAVPDGRYEFEDRMDDYGPGSAPLAIHALLEVRGDELEVDFAGTSPQVGAGINCYFGFTLAYTLFAIKSVLDPLGRSNAGSLRPLTINAPAGCLLNPTHPSPGGGRAVALTRIVDVVIGALSQAVPDRVVAAPSQFMNSAFGGIAPSGEQFVYFELLFGGTGARPDRDGSEAMCFGLDVNNIPVEVYEATSPMIVERFSIIPDSGGPGLYRGGCGLRKDIRVLSDGVHLTNMGDRTTTPPYGLFGGHPGTVSSSIAERQSDDRQPVVLESKGTYPLRAGDLVSLRLSGAGGVGDPLERDPMRVAEDVKQGYVTPVSARQDYGVVVTPTGVLDPTATRCERLARRNDALHDRQEGKSRDEP
jgi:N-methylhydantoinase B